jgi:hypothetical protein
MAEKLCDSSEEGLVSGREVVRRLDRDERHVSEQVELIEEMREGVTQGLTSPNRIVVIL